ncbi:uncharacterized protein FSUBG_1912 [Fusarium subglutinans]|uniref:Uncharacterized protein n=1 Tax=Gibberella subglutinans TaxID=42677 RepID=A0A8H5V7Q4_GIBSU|nr:uncharacterized protein FSUBG_1912 [Fusarium subglutinans]KAF5611885.1 hypothetical protein FSUBG_1912 [Fusarium subglutinans]
MSLLASLTDDFRDSHRIHVSIMRTYRRADEGFNIYHANDPESAVPPSPPSTRRFNLQLGQGPIPKAAKKQAKNSAQDFNGVLVYF